MDNALTTVEVNRLEHLESVIEKGVSTFMAVGNALAEIRTSRLYREQYETFEQYCLERWEFTAARGRQLMSAVEAIASLPEHLPKPARAAHAEALAAVDEDDRADVWMDALEEAESEDRPVTTADVKAAAARRKDDAKSAASLGERNLAELEPILKETLAALKAAMTAAERLAQTSASQWLLTQGSALLKHIRDARDHVSACRPAGICPLCGGEGCKRCFGTGWLNKTRMQQETKQ